MVSISDAQRIRREHISESRTRAGETGKRHSETAAAAGVAKGSGGLGAQRSELSEALSTGHDIINLIS
jgi:hypothetical protein